MSLIYSFLKPGEKLSDNFKSKLSELNRRKNKKSITFQEYLMSLIELLGKEPNLSLTEEKKFFLGGFICGEGSINVSVKKQQSPPFIKLSPQFSLTQHANGSSHLLSCLGFFQTGRIYYKSGSNATLVYTVDKREDIIQKVLPFWEKYITPYQPGEENARFKNFEKLIFLLEEKTHLNLDGLYNTVLPLWSSLRKQEGQSNEKFKNLEEAQAFILEKWKKTKTRLDTFKK